MSLLASVKRRARLMRYGHRRVEGTAGYDWKRINHSRMEIINRAIASAASDRRRYLEIGCDSDLCFNAIIASHKVGVDPKRGGTVRATSDAFFASNRQTFDVIFVDGLHTYEQVRRDAINGLACLSVGGLMFFHDMLPNSWIEEAPVRVGDSWAGDVWKLGLDLAVSPGVTYRTIVADAGVGVLRKVAPSPRLPEPAKDDRRNFADFLRTRGQMNLIDFEAYLAFLDETAIRDRIG